MAYKQTLCHVSDVTVWETKFADVNVTFVGDLKDIDASIDSLTSDTSDGLWYTLDGVKLDGKPTEPGIYIMDGKKIVIGN
jgi:hypothetical protein